MTAAATARRDRLAGLLGHWDALVDPKVGIVRRVAELRADDDEPDFFHYLSTACDTGRFTQLSNFGNNGGVATHPPRGDRQGARRGRRALLLGDLRRGRRSCSRPTTSSAEPAVAAGAVRAVLPGPVRGDGFPWRPFTARRAAVPGRADVARSRGEPVLVPAAAVYVPYHYLARAPTRRSCSRSPPAWRAGTRADGRGAVRPRARRSSATRSRSPGRRGSAVRGCAHETLSGRGAGPARRYEAVGLRVEVMDITTDLGVPDAADRRDRRGAELAGAWPSRRRPTPSPEVAADQEPRGARAHAQVRPAAAHRSRRRCRSTSAAGHPAVGDQRDPPALLLPAGGRAASGVRLELAGGAAVRGRGAAGHARRAARDGGRRLARPDLEPIACDLTTPDVAALGLARRPRGRPGPAPAVHGPPQPRPRRRAPVPGPAALGFDGPEPGSADNPFPHPFPEEAA